jgi:RNA polymerase sigma-70 factor (ECF subfamily)
VDDGRAPAKLRDAALRAERAAVLTMNVSLQKLVTSELGKSEPGETPSQDETQFTETSFEVVYADWFHDVRSWIRALGGMDADQEDLAQEVFIVVRRKLCQFDGRNLRGWLYRITQRTVRDYRRAAWFRRLLSRRTSLSYDSAVLNLIEPGETPPEQLERREAEATLNVALERMNTKHRAAFVLFELEGYSGKEIAELEGVKLATVWTRLHQARKVFVGIVKELREEGRLG